MNWNASKVDNKNITQNFSPITKIELESTINLRK